MNSVEYAKELIKFDSTCYRSNQAVSDYVERTLSGSGCVTERIEYTDSEGVLKVNIVARRGSGAGGLAYFGHTDVVTTDDWSVQEHGPFEPVVRDGRLYGRGSTDMKGSIACMFAALDSMQGRALQHPLYISCSSDEETDHRGVVEIIERSRLFQDLVAGRACGIVGEPTRLDVVYAHKGGCQIAVTSHGRAAHSSTREGLNANLAMVPFLQEVKAVYDETESDPAWMDDEFDPPTICLNLGINDHNRAVNITAPQSICTVCFRPMPTTDVERIVERVRVKAEEYGLEFQILARNPPFRRDPRGDFVQQCARLASGNAPRTVAYGSEAGNLASMEDLVVLGPGDIAQAHKSDEWISLEQLEAGQRIYAELIRKFCF